MPTPKKPGSRKPGQKMPGAKKPGPEKPAKKKRKPLSPEQRRRYKKAYREKYPEAWLKQRREQKRRARAKQRAEQRAEKIALGISKPAGMPLGKTYITPKEALVRGEIWKGGFSPTKIAKKFKKQGIYPSYVARVKAKLRDKEGIIFPKPKWRKRGLLSPTSKAGRVRAEILNLKKAGKPIRPTEIAETLGIDTSHVTSQMSTMRKRGVIFPDYLRSEKSKAARIRGEIWKGNFDPNRIVKKLSKYGVNIQDVGSVIYSLREEGVIIPSAKAGRKPKTRGRGKQKPGKSSRR